METLYASTILHASSMFKSYYVVWKPRGNDEICGNKILFKSYYVVWKLKNITQANKSWASLNRTM